MKKRRNYKSCGQSRTHQLRVGKRGGGLCDRGAKAQAILYRLALLFLCVGGLIPLARLLSLILRPWCWERTAGRVRAALLGN